MSDQDDIDRLRYLQLKAKAGGSQQSTPEPSLMDQAPGIASQAFQAANPIEQTKKFFETDPATMQRVGGPALPIAGGAVGGPIGASLGEVARQATGAVLAPDTVPKTPLGVGASVMGAGIMQEPKIIPGVGPVAEKASELASKYGPKVVNKLANTAQAFSGGRAGDFKETFKKGYKTYLAPSMEKASDSFGKALKSATGEEVAPTMVERMGSAISSEASQAGKYLKEIAEKMDKGNKMIPDPTAWVSAKEALKAKQALDDVIDTVPFWQTKRKRNLFEIKSEFDDILSSQSGELKQASNDYRGAVLKQNMTKLLPVNKRGETSRLAPMLSTLAGSITGVGSSAAKGAAAVALPLAFNSPALYGLGSATAGEATRGLMKLGQNPETRQALLQVLQKIMRKEGQNGPAQ